MTRRVFIVFLALCGTGCRDETVTSGPAVDVVTPTSNCPTQPIEGGTTPHTLPQHREAKTWIDALPEGAADAVLVKVEDAPELSKRFSEITGAWRDPLEHALADADKTELAIEERFTYLRERVTAGAFVEGKPGELAAAYKRAQGSTGVDHVRLVRDEAALYCVPLAAGLFKTPVDEDFDRNRCASLHPGELVRVLRRSSDGWYYVHAGHTVGWLKQDQLGARLNRDAIDAWTRGARLVPQRDAAVSRDGFALRLGVAVPLLATEDDHYRVLLPDGEGLRESIVDKEQPVQAGHRPLTRAALFEAAFSELDSPYGWGGRDGERDCSRYLRDLFAIFGIELARHSGVQAQLGTHNIDLHSKSETHKRELIEQWSSRGVVLLFMPGHIMLYLGRDAGHDYAISSMSEWLEPCEGGEDTVHRIDRVAVTTLEIGRGTERTAFIERITKLVVFAPTREEQG